jgi:hypothetical protein
MTTHVLVGSPNNLFVFDFGNSGTGSARYTGDEDDILNNWELVQHNVSVSGSRGSLYRRPESKRRITIVNRG